MKLFHLLIITAAAAVSCSSVAAASAASCSSAADCSLNGDCVAGACACDPQWSGGSAACDVLALRPASRGAPGYRNSSGVSSWGGMSVRDDAGAWHLFAAEMVNNCSLSTWKTNSRVVRGVGAAPGGPFSVVQQIAAPFAHNPKIMRAADGTYVLYSIGSGLWNTTAQQCDAAQRGAALSPAGAVAELPVGPGPCGNGCGPEPPYNGGCGISLGSAPTPEGPWTFAPLQIVDQNRSSLLDAQQTNPSAVFMEDGSVLMAFNAGWNHGYVETIGLAKAPSWRGPYTLFSPDPILLNADGTHHQCEDPFLWRTARGLHIMVHNQQDAGIARYAHSADGGKTWALHGGPGPYDGVVQWDDGTSDSWDVERPQFVFDPDTGAPLFLTNGASSGPLSFTLFRPLWQTPPPPPPPPARLVNANGECLATNGSAPCWTNPSGYWICALYVSAAACGEASALWQVGASSITSAAPGAGLGAPLNVDCADCLPGRVLKLISSGTSALTLVGGQLVVGGCSAPRMCVTTGAAGGARSPCGGGAEPWSDAQPHLAECSDAATQGWRVEAAQ
jgi:hypothetical protein